MAADPESILRFYRTTLAARHEQPCLDDQPLTWRSTDNDAVLHFQRGNEFSCLVNLGTTPVALPRSSRIVLASTPLPLAATVLPSDTAVWLRH